MKYLSTGTAGFIGSIIASSLFVLPANAAMIVDNTITQQFTDTLSTPLYLENPLGERFEVTYLDIKPALSTDTIGSGSILVSIDTSILLQQMAERLEKNDIIPTAGKVTIQETSTGTFIPEAKTGIGYTVQHGLFEELLLRQISNPKAKAAVIKIPTSTIEPSVVLRSPDGTERSLEIVSHGVSDFRGSSKARIHNIETAMALFQGKRVEPGAVFSFNDILGVVDGSTGYEKELVIKGDRTIPDYGGGVCQVSSTLYRSALLAGFTITERKPHSYAVSYYTPWGTDATVYPGVIDLKFKNTFPDPVYIHFFIEGTILHSMLYGTSDGREVSLGASNTYAFTGAPNPKVEYVSTLAPGKRVWKEYGHNGFSAWVERTIVSSTGDVMKEKILSTYEPRGGFVLEGKAAEVPLPTE